MVGVEVKRRGEASDVGDERGVLQRRRRQEGQLADFAVGRGGGPVGAVRVAGGALIWGVVLLHPETDDLPEQKRKLVSPEPGPKVREPEDGLT